MPRKLECPRFSGLTEEFRTWRVRIEDWLDLADVPEERQGMEIRMALAGKAFDLTMNIEREKLKGKDGAKTILEILDKKYKGDEVVDKYNKVERYLDIQRKEEENVRDFINRYEEAAHGCFKATGAILQGEMKGIHLLKKSGVTENQKQLVLAACGSQELTFERISEVMERVFGKLGKKEEKDEGWWGQRREKDGNDSNRRGRGGQSFRNRGREGKKNPMRADGTVTKCVICKSEYHWAKECPKNINNKRKQTAAENFAEEVVEPNLTENIFLENTERWEEATEGLIDTGCRNSIIGDL